MTIPVFTSERPPGGYWAEAAADERQPAQLFELLRKSAIYDTPTNRTEAAYLAGVLRPLRLLEDDESWQTEDVRRELHLMIWLCAKAYRANLEETLEP